MFSNTQHPALPSLAQTFARGLKSRAILGIRLTCALLLAAGALTLPASAQLAPVVVLHLTPPLGTVQQGQPVTLTANVSLSGTPATSGTVVFLEVDLLGAPLLSVQVGTAQVTNSGTATVIFTPGAGVHSYVAVLLPSTGSLLPVTSAAVVVTSTPNGTYRTSDTVSAAAAGLGRYKLTDITSFYGTATPTGTITFTNNGVPVGLPIPAASLTFTPNFAAPLSTPTGATVTSLAVVTGDFNNDGIADLATTNFGDNNVSILLGKGNGTFSAAKTYATGQYPYAMAVGDFNNDGFQDLAVTNLLDNTVSILLNDKTGGFLAQTAFTDKPGTLIAAPYSIAAADFNGDGKLDLITTNLQTLDLSFLKGNGDGTFAAPTVAFSSSALVDPYMSAAADFDGDGIMDLALLDANAPTAANPTTTGSVYFLKGAGDGTFTSLRTTLVGSTPIALTVGNFDNTGGPDVAVVNSGSTGANGLTVLLNPGNGVFQKETATTGSGPVSVAVVDFNNDGMPDLAVANNADTTISVFTNQGVTAMKLFNAAHSTLVPTIASPYQLLATDFSGDGRQDLAVIAFGGTSLGVHLGIQTATVTTAALFGTPTNPVSAYTSGILDSYASSSSAMPGPLVKRVAKK